MGVGWCPLCLPWVVGGVVAPSPALPALGGGVGCVVGLGVCGCVPCLPWVVVGGGCSCCPACCPACPADTTDTQPPKEKIFFANPDGLRTEPGRTPLTMETNDGSVCAPSPAGHGNRRKHKPSQGNRRTLKNRNEPRQQKMEAKKIFSLGGWRLWRCARLPFLQTPMD